MERSGDVDVKQPIILTTSWQLKSCPGWNLKVCVVRMDVFLVTMFGDLGFAWVFLLLGLPSMNKHLLLGKIIKSL